MFFDRLINTVCRARWCFPLWARQTVHARLHTKHRELSFFTFSLSNHVGRHTHIRPRVSLLSIRDGQLSTANLPENTFNEPVNTKRSGKSELDEFPVWDSGCSCKTAKRKNPLWSCRLWGQGERRLSSRRWWVQGARVEADTPDWPSPRPPRPHPVGSVWSHRVTLQDRIKGGGIVNSYGKSSSFTWLVWSVIRVRGRENHSEDELLRTGLLTHYIYSITRQNLSKPPHGTLCNILVLIIQPYPEGLWGSSLITVVNIWVSMVCINRPIYCA